MRRIAITALAVGLLVGACFFLKQAFAQHGHGAHGSNPAKQATVTVTGEVVDLSCYLIHDAKGASHEKCAIACLKKGLPMGILTSDGKLYVVLEDHKKPDAYQTAKGLAARTVKAVGKVVSKHGVSAIAVTSVQEVK